ncbi:MAG: D-glycerate dehydrogenase [Phycisphaerae bacterium]|nr:D-glycerate dehydrogenase [Phycisphaerae bacterium]
MKANVAVTRRIPRNGIELLRGECDRVEVNPNERSLTQAEFLAMIAGRDGVLTELINRIDDEAFDAAGPRCKVFANCAVGFNNVDLAAANRRGIVITNTPDVLTETTADLAWALIMASARRIVESDTFLRSGQWDGWGPMQFHGHDVHGATLGIIGAGRIGTATARRSIGFDMKVLYYDASGMANAELDRLGGRQVGLDELLAESDFVSLHVPLTDQTHHMIGQAELARMKPTAHLINTSRGPVIDEAALVSALGDHVIAGAGLDVFEKEPAITPGLTDLDNVVCLPHIGSASGATRAKMAELAATNLLAVLKGQRPPTPVNPEVLDR